jgi:hypothetical protein
MRDFLHALIFDRRPEIVSGLGEHAQRGVLLISLLRLGHKSAFRYPVSAIYRRDAYAGMAATAPSAGRLPGGRASAKAL